MPEDRLSIFHIKRDATPGEIQANCRYDGHGAAPRVDRDDATQSSSRIVGPPRAHRRLLPRREVRVVARLRPRERGGGVAAAGHRAGRDAVARLPRLARPVPGRVPGERHDGGVGLDVARHRRWQHARGAPRRLPREAVRERPEGLRPGAGHLHVRGARRARRRGRERDGGGDDPGAGGYASWEGVWAIWLTWWLGD